MDENNKYNSFNDEVKLDLFKKNRAKSSSKTQRIFINFNNSKENDSKLNSHKKNQKTRNHLSDKDDKELFKQRLTQYNKKSKTKLTYESFMSELKEKKEVIMTKSEKKESSKKLIKIVKLQNNERTFTDIYDIKNFLINNQLLDMLQFTNSNEEIIDKILINCCINCKYKYFRKDYVLYRVNDIIDKFYMIIQGNIGIYKWFSKIIYMSGFKFFQYIYDLYLNKEFYILKLVLEQNCRLFPLKESIFPKLNIIIASKLIQKYNKNKNAYINIFNSIEDIFKNCFVDKYNYKKEKNNIKYDIFDFDYELLCKTNDDNIVYIYECHLLHEYRDGKFLEPINTQEIINNYKSSLRDINNNNNENKENSKNDNINFTIEKRRICTARVMSDTHLCYFDLNNYYHFLLTEYKKILHKDSKYLIDNFIFKKLSKQFEEKYFPFFEYEEVNINRYLFKENESLEYIYFMKDGIIELTLNKNIYQVQKLLNELFLIKKRKYEEIEQNQTIKNNNNINLPLNIDNEITSAEHEIRLVILEEKDTIGLECLYYGLNYFYNAKVINKKAILYKISKKKLLEILDIERENIEIKYIHECERKIDFLMLRLFNLKKVKLNLIQNKKLNYLLNNYSQYNGRNDKIFSFNITQKNHKMKLIKRNNEFIGKNKNDKIKNIINIFKNSFINDKNKKYLSKTKKYKNSNKNLYNKINNQINSRNPNNTKNKLYQSEKQLSTKKNMKVKEISFIYKKIIDNYSNSYSSENNTNTNSLLLLPGVISSPRIKKNRIEEKKNFSLKSEKYLLNKVKKQTTYDDLFINKINHYNNNYNLNNLSNFESIDKLKVNKNIITMKNYSQKKTNVFVPWKYFHYNINIKPISSKKNIKKNYWYKNISKLTEENFDKDYSSINNWIYGVKTYRNNVKLITSKDFIKNAHVQLSS